jgi:LysM repeat protein
MLVIENDWIEYEATVARRSAVRGGAACATRFPAASVRSAPLLRAVPPLVPAPRRAAAPKRPLRLTPRGRFVLLVLPTLALLSAPAPVSASAAAVRVTVDAGDSLWTVAQRVAPQQDPRDVVVALERANGLGDATVQAGQVLVVPEAVLTR